MFVGIMFQHNSGTPGAISAKLGIHDYISCVCIYIYTHTYTVGPQSPLGGFEKLWRKLIELATCGLRQIIVKLW
jgi:hypothetical protein